MKYTIRCKKPQDAEAVRRAFEAIGFPYSNGVSPNRRNAGQFTTSSDPRPTLRRFGLRVWSSEQYELRAEMRCYGR